MSLLTLLALFVAAFAAGTVDAIAGGGGLITLPALLAAGLPPHTALATNKGASIWGSGASLFGYARAGQVNTERARFTFPAGMLGAMIGSRLVLWLAPALLRPLVIVLLFLASAVLFVRKRDELGAGEKNASLWRWISLALLIGAYDGFFGPGTGTFLIVGIVLFCGQSLARATADAKVVNFASNLAAMLMFFHYGQIEWRVAALMGVGQLFGGLLGVRLALKGGAKLIRRLVVAVSGTLVLKLSWDLLRQGLV
ncbi:MAG TPA: TSUP family transporter [Polyangiaceae bacterium]|nr:TSUP family transporter [Polyangiaceae bacterium]